MLSYTQLTTPVTRDEALELLRTLLAELGFSSTSWQSGSAQLTALYLGAEIYSKLSEAVVSITKLALNDTSDGEGLERFSKSHYDNTKVSAVATQGTMVFAVASGEGPYTPAIGDVVVTNGGQTYRNISSDTLTSAAAVTLSMEAEIPGAAGNIAPNSTLELVTTMAGVTVTNPPLAGSTTWITRTGSDEETPQQLRNRNSTKWGTLSIEVAKAGVENLMLNVEYLGSKPIKKVAIDDTNPRGPGTVDVYVAGQASVLGAPEVAAAQAALDLRFFGNDMAGGEKRVKAIAAPTLTLVTSGTVYFDKNFSATAIKEAVEAALLEFVGTIPLGGFDYRPLNEHIVTRSDVEDEIESTEGVKTVQLALPASDLIVSAFSLVVPPSSYGLTYTPLTR